MKSQEDKSNEENERSTEKYFKIPCEPFQTGRPAHQTG
jgi:hypothetical protein